MFWFIHKLFAKPQEKNTKETASPIFINNNSKVGVLLLHGFSGSPQQFGTLIDFFAEQSFNVYAPIIAGHGSSHENLLKTTPEDWKKSVQEAYQAIKEISEKIFIIGNSFGSNLGLWLINQLKNESSLKGIIILGAPIFLRFHKLIWLRLYTYGFLQKYYKKPGRFKKNTTDKFAYSIMPTKSLREFLSFIKKETMPNLNKIQMPVYICHSDADPIVHPKSAKYIFEKINSSKKEICILQSKHHVITNDFHQKSIFEQILNFIKKHSEN